MLTIDQLSFWEKDQYFTGIDFLVIGAGIVGCTTALALRKEHPNAKILLLEQGYLPAGASTKNAGFACFGSASELVSDLNSMPANVVWDTVAMRWEGLQQLLSHCPENIIHYKKTGSHDLFTAKENQIYSASLEKLDYFNTELEKISGIKNIYAVDNPSSRFGFRSIENAISNKEEGMIDTGRMMVHFHQKLAQNSILLLGGINVREINDTQINVNLTTNIGTILAAKVCITTNGFAGQFLPKANLKPARAQVLVTKPIKDLKLEGTFHYDAGYYYFRNIGDRVLLGGGRNLDFEGETTPIIGTTDLIKNALATLLEHVILPDTPFEIDYYWAGIMGVGNEKKPIIEQISTNVFAGVRMGGMGVAIGSLVGEQLSKLVSKQ
jgi:gamma-glutamylputrescine oxidase